MAKNVIKMIKILILIQTGVFGLLAAGCSDDGATGRPEEMTPDGNVSSEPSSGSEDPLKQLENEGKLPKIGTGGKFPVLDAPTGTNSEGLSLPPPNVDPDQDNVVTGDNCPNTFNPGQEDANHNGVGDACE